MFRPDKPLPALPKGLGDKLSAFATSAATGAKGAAERARAKSPSNDRGGTGVSSVAMTKTLFEQQTSGSSRCACRIGDLRHVIPWLSCSRNESKSNTPSYASMAMSAARHVPVGTAVDMTKRASLSFMRVAIT